MSICANCGAPLVNGARICNNCGTQQKPQGIYRFHFRFAMIALLWDLLLPVMMFIWGAMAVAISHVPYSSETKGIIEFFKVTLPGEAFLGTMVLGIVVKIASIVIAIRAKTLRYPKAGTSVILSVVALILSVVGYALFFVLAAIASNF